MAEVRKVYRTRSQAVVIGSVLVVDVGLGVDGALTGVSHPTGGFVFGGFAVLLFAVFAGRAALSAMVVDGRGVRVRNPFRTVLLAWDQISGFEVGRYKILGCVCVINLRDGRVMPAFGVQGIAGQPRRRSSVAARVMVEELNERLAAEVGRLGSGEPRQA